MADDGHAAALCRHSGKGNRRLRGLASLRYPATMSEDNDDLSGPAHWIRERLGVIIGIVGLVAWFVMLWLMFGDVL